MNCTPKLLISLYQLQMELGSFVDGYSSADEVLKCNMGKQGTPLTELTDRRFCPKKLWVKKTFGVSHWYVMLLTSKG